MMFTAPPEQTLEWSEEGVQSWFRFIRRLWKAVWDQVNAPPPADAITTNEFDKTKLNAEQKEMRRRRAHHTLEKVTWDIGRRRSLRHHRGRAHGIAERHLQIESESLRVA